jgi:uncharacterized protein (DUF4415 family)
MGTKFSSKRPLTDEEEAEIQNMIASDPDNPELTDEELAKMKPFREVLPDLAKSIDRQIAQRGRPPLPVTKKPVTIRLDPEVIAKFKATGPGWQSRMNDVLKAAKIG